MSSRLHSFEEPKKNRKPTSTHKHKHIRWSSKGEGGGPDTTGGPSRADKSTPVKKENRVVDGYKKNLMWKLAARAAVCRGDYLGGGGVQQGRPAVGGEGNTRNGGCAKSLRSPPSATRSPRGGAVRRRNRWIQVTKEIGREQFDPETAI